jgi:oligosaccharide repeat unit polymerase
MFFFKKIKLSVFHRSIIIGLAIWLFFFFTIPVKVSTPLSSGTIFFIIANFCCLFIGYSSFNFSENKKNETVFSIQKFFFLIVILVLISLIFRIIDIFYFRNLSLYNPIFINKKLANNDQNFSLLLGLLSMFRLLYFVPLVIYKSLNIKNKRWIFMLSILFFLIPITEGFLRGSRRLILQPILLMFVTLLIYNRGRIKFNLKTFFLMIFIFFLLGIIGNSVLIKREALNSTEFYDKITTAKYNDFLPLKKENLKYFKTPETNGLLKNIYFSYVHFGQYVTHGLFEFNYTKEKDFKLKYGLYNGYIIVKLFNKLNISDIPLNKLVNPSGRITYVTFFGGLYIDFKWFSIILMFLFGIFQRYIFDKSLYNFYYSPLKILLIFVNVFLLVFNFFRSELIITIILYFFLMFIIKKLKI